jgi:hypothetical protein
MFAAYLIVVIFWRNVGIFLEKQAFCGSKRAAEANIIFILGKVDSQY